MNSSVKEIKKAFRKSAMKNHPDRGGDEEVFKRINEAHEVLTDPLERALFDASIRMAKMEHAEQESPSNSQQRPPSTGPFSSPRPSPHTSSPRTWNGSKGTPDRCNDEVHPYPVTLEQMYNGIIQHLRVTKRVICKGCRGTGCNLGREDSRGTDRAPSLQNTLADSTACRGCRGMRVIQELQVLSVVVEKGMNVGHEIRFKEASNQHPGMRAGLHAPPPCSTPHFLP
jgi:DnaJ family protein A protein 2